MTSLALYQSIAYILIAIPFVVIAIAYYYAKNIKWQIRYPLMILFGWMVFVVFVVLLNYYSFYYAPTQELMEAAANGDGAANAFAVVFGWLYALIVLLFLELANKILFYIRKWFGKAPEIT